jgi:hypothetical protein
MTDHQNKMLDRFEPGGDLGAIEDRETRARRIASLPPAERALAQESARFADLCQYFSQQQMDLPHEIAAEIFRVSMLPMADRTVAMRRLNKILMEHLDDAGQGSGVRQ